MRNNQQLNDGVVMSVSLDDYSNDDAARHTTSHWTLARRFLLSDAGTIDRIYHTSQQRPTTTCADLAQKPSATNPRHRSQFYRNR